MPGDPSLPAENRGGQVALDVAPEGQAIPAPPATSAGAGTGGAPVHPLRLHISRVEGALSTSLVAPCVRIHLVDAASGYRWGKPAGQQCVFNENKDGAAYLRTKQEPGKEQRSQSLPWMADSGQSSFFRPFCTLPKRRGISRDLPPWDEAFLLQVPLDSRMAFLFEVVDTVTQEESVRLVPVVWGFCHCSALHLSRRRLRVQLWCYRRRNFFGRVALEEDSDDIPLVVQEYLAAGVGEERPGVMAAWMASILGRSRQKCSAALEFSLDILHKPIQVDHPTPQLPQLQDMKSTKSVEVVTAVKQGEPSPKAETVAEEEILGHLAPQHVRQKGQACLLPDELLWQIPSGKRGASRMAISPTSTLLAVATVRSAGSSELKIFSLASGRLYATCGGHDALIQDLSWHSFRTSREGLTSPPLLISAGGSRVVIHEVPDLDTPLGLGAPQLKVHARVNLAGTVHSVRPHPSMSTDPRCVILLCAGHFGLTLTQVSRELQAAPGQGSAWIAQQPQMQQVPLQSHHKSGYGREAESSVSEVLCVRFSTQSNAAENVYVTDAGGHIMLYQIRYDAGVGVTASRVRTYAGSELLGTAIYNLEVVTQQLLDGKRISSIQLSMADDWVLTFSRDHVIRLVSLQRGVLKVEQKMMGIQCSTYSVRGTISPDGTTVVCGSENGELLFWRDGKAVVPPTVPQVRLAGPLMDVVWSERHHLVACCAMDENALPLLAFVGGEENAPPKVPQEKEVALPHQPPPLGSTQESMLAMSGISIDSEGHRRWADHWINHNDNSRSALTVDEKRRMKENILLRILDKKAEESHGYTSLQSPGGT